MTDARDLGLPAPAPGLAAPQPGETLQAGAVPGEIAAGLHETVAACAGSGFRLQHVEVFNWGTFDQRVWRLPAYGESILLTGDIGSGKSTLVDALTTLLVAPHKLAYNKAAGAELRERSLRSYVLGHYKSERTDTGSGTRAVALRDHNDYSVLLAVFSNAAIGETITLAQVFWMKDPHDQPERLYVVADARLSIGEHFAGFGADIAQLRKRLRATSGVAVHDTFLPYGAEFRRRFGIPGEQAMDLFHQTVSMKSVGNLSAFVREHVLEPFPVEARLSALIANFDELNLAHEAVLKARAQLGQLTALVAGCDRLGEQARHAQLWRECRGALRPWLLRLRRDTCEQQARALQSELDEVTDRLASLADRRSEQRLRRDALVEAIALNGGNRIGQLGAEIARLERTRDERSGRARQYSDVAHAVGLQGAAGAATFAANRRAIEEGLASCAARRDDAANRLTEAGVVVRELGRQHSELTAELESLRRRSSNIARKLIEQRAALCEQLRIAPDALPFAGELIRVRQESGSWEAAAEHALRGLTQALLVPDIHYRAVAGWASRARPGTQLSFYRARYAGTAGQRALHPQSLVHHLEVMPGSPFSGWLQSELEVRFDFACCADNQQFEREKPALHRDGRLKTADGRFDQDVRVPPGERAGYMLGWSNEAKIAALTKQERDLATRIQAHVAQVSALRREIDEHNATLGHWQQLAVFASFKDLDWKAAATSIEQLERERQALSTSTDTLGDLRRQLDELGAGQHAIETELNELAGMRGALVQRLSQVARTAEEAPAVDDVPGHIGAQLEHLQRELLGNAALTLDGCDRLEADMRELLHKRAEEEERHALPLRDTAIGAMREYARAWPVDTREVDVHIGAAGEFRHMLKVLEMQELPRFIERFQQSLNEDTVRGIALLHAQYGREREQVRERVAALNETLHGIDYNTGRYLRLEAVPNPDVELCDFQHDLRACIDSAAGTDDADLETRFLQVKRLIQRFRGREGSAELDQRWTRKVTDVRNWFVYTASERWRGDDREHEHYADAAGRSGGQKEKLAYTVLAAGLACQFGLGQIERARSFRFAMIDEAFGRGSDDSARYGLELFRRMGLQLLVVTPLQKIHVIEPYVAGLGFVHSEAGQRSMLHYLGIGEYREQRDAGATEE
jgi:uncharacterized protein YPO0396